MAMQSPGEGPRSIGLLQEARIARHPEAHDRRIDGPVDGLRQSRSTTAAIVLPSDQFSHHTERSGGLHLTAIQGTKRRAIVECYGKVKGVAGLQPQSKLIA